MTSEMIASLSRRNALKLAGAAALAGGGGIAATQGIAQSTNPAFDRLDHVHFLLNIHWFQAGLYSRALKGEGLTWDLTGEPAGTPPISVGWARINFTDRLLGDFVEELLETEIAQLRTLLGVAKTLDGPGKIINLRQPDMWLDGSATFSDGFSRVFAPIYNEGTPNFNPYTQDHLPVVICYIRDIMVTAYQLAVSKVPGDTTFPAFLAIQSYGAAIIRDMLYTTAQQPGSRILTIIAQLAARDGTGVLTNLNPSTSAAGTVSNIVPTDDRGRTKISSYKTVLQQLVGRVPVMPNSDNGIFFKQDFVGRINAGTLV